MCVYILCWLHNLIWFYVFSKQLLAKGCLQKCQSGHSFKGGLFQKPIDPGNRHDRSITCPNVKKLQNKLLTLNNVSLRRTSLADSSEIACVCTYFVGCIIWFGFTTSINNFYALATFRRNFVFRQFFATYLLKFVTFWQNLWQKTDEKRNFASMWPVH